jgi:hypothetical protein
MGRALRAGVVGVGLLCTGSALATPASADPHAQYKAAARLAADDDNEKALILVDQGLASAPKDLQLLQLKGNLLLKTRDYEGALATYQAYLDAGAKGANRREAQKIVGSLKSVKSTALEIAVTNGPAFIYLDSKTQGMFCTAEPACKKAVLPGEYKVIAERPGFDRWTGRVTVEAGKLAKASITLAEKPSLLTVRVAQPGARITVDGKPYDAPIPVPGGTHAIEVTLAGHATAKLAALAHEAKPLDVEVAMTPLVPLALTPRGATLLLDDHAIELEADGLAIPPGDHVLVARAGGFHDVKLAIPAARAADYKLTVELPALGAMLRLAGAPSGARVVVDGKSVGAAPLAGAIEVAPGKHTVELRVSGYRPYRTTAAFGADQSVELQVGTLRRDSRKRTYLAGAATGGALVLGSVFSVAALGRQSAYDTRARLAGVTADDAKLDGMKRDGERYSLFADVGFGLAIAGIGITTYFFLHEGRGESEGKLQFGVSPTGAVASGRF